MKTETKRKKVDNADILSKIGGGAGSQGVVMSAADVFLTEKQNKKEQNKKKERNDEKLIEW